MAAIVMKSMYSRIVGMRPEPTIAGIDGGHLVDGGERDEDVLPWVRRGWSRSVASVARARVPSEPMMSWVRS